MSTHESKFRPYFTNQEILKLISHLKRYPSPEMKGIMQYLEGFSVKINHGIVQSSAEIKKPLHEILSLETELPIEVKIRQQKLFDKWRLAPERCSPNEIEMVQEYRFSHDLMTEQEEHDYEISKGLV